MRKQALLPFLLLIRITLGTTITLFHLHCFFGTIFFIHFSVFFFFNSFLFLFRFFSNYIDIHFCTFYVFVFDFFRLKFTKKIAHTIHQLPKMIIPPVGAPLEYQNNCLSKSDDFR